MMFLHLLAHFCACKKVSCCLVASDLILDTPKVVAQGSGTSSVNIINNLEEQLGSFEGHYFRWSKTSVLHLCSTPKGDTHYLGRIRFQSLLSAWKSVLSNPLPSSCPLSSVTLLSLTVLVQSTCEEPVQPSTILPWSPNFFTSE